MDSSEPALVKDFAKSTKILPLTMYGLSTFREFQNAETENLSRDHLKKIGLTEDEISLYKNYEAGILEGQSKMEKSVMEDKLNVILTKISSYIEAESDTSLYRDSKPGPSKEKPEKTEKKPSKSYPDGHPMNVIKELEGHMFIHHTDDDILPPSKRRKILRRLEKKQEELLAKGKEFIPCPPNNKNHNNERDTLWDVQASSSRDDRPHSSHRLLHIGPQPPTMYTIRDNKILRLEPVMQHETGEQEYRAVNMVVPENGAEEHLLEGTRISVDDIRKIERFKNYEPGIPSKVLYLKNISNAVTEEQVSILFNQFIADNGAPIDIRLMSGRMSGQAFISFRHEHVAMQALEEINGTILSGKPIIAEFGRNSNRVQLDED